MRTPDPRNPSTDQGHSALAALLRSAGALSVLALGMASTALAQTAPATTTTTSAAAPAAATDQPVTMGAFVVNGYAASLEESLNVKRASSSNIEVISAEDVGKFPDTNLAESLSHLPGVTVDRLFGEGERVSIEGTDPNLNRVLLNGEPVSSADWYVLDNQSRQFNYLLISPDVVNQAVVYKSWEPRLLEGSVGATVDVTTRNPIDMAPMVFTGVATDDFNDRSHKNEGSVSAMFSWHNESKTFGIMIGGEDNREYLRRDGVESLSEPTDTTLGVGGPLPGQPPGPWVTAEVVNSAEFLQLRHHQGGNIAIDFKPTDRLTIEFTGLYVKQTMDNVNFSWYIYPGDNWSGLPNITNPTVSNGVLSSYTINSAPLVIDAFNRAAEIETQDYDAKLIYKGDNFDLTANAGFTRATGGTQHQFFAEYFVFANANINVNKNSSQFTVTGVPGPDPNATSLNSGADFSAAGEPSFDYGNIASNPEVDDEKWVQLDMIFPLKGALKDFQAGMRFSDHKAGENGVVVSVPGADEVNTPLSAIGVSNAPSNYLQGLPNITSSMSQHVMTNSYGGVANFIGNLPEGNGQTLLQYFDGTPAQDGAVFTATPTFNIDERINAAYLEADFADGPLSGNVGARFVETTTTSGSYNLSTTPPSFQSTQSTYTNFLPAVNLVYNLAPDQLTRFAVSEVIARPNTSAEADYVQLYDSTLAGVGGNANLKPYESTNIDWDYEFYFAKNSYFAVDLFYKDISNYIINATGQEQWKDYSLTGDPTETYEITRPSNGGAATSEGATFSYQQIFVYGVGLEANYTILHTSSASGPLPYSSKNELNISPFYENKWGLFRLTYSWRDDYESASFNGTSAVWTAPFAELDANAQINITKNLSIVLRATNLLDETYHQYFKNPTAASVLADEYKFGRQYSAGLHWTF
ncbi:MAG TPA: TonB-dependent receptor [Opitutaceae bacterium]|jgi:iron complex outermembrane receptor protein